MRKDHVELPIATIGQQGYFNRTFKNDLGRQCHYKEYRYWHNMNTRCNNENYKIKHPTYKNVTMSESFSDYNLFVRWCREQPEFYNDGWVLDKDIICPSNKIYSEDFCVFVPLEVNSFFLVRSRSRDTKLPVGVSWCKKEGKFKAYCSQLDGRNKTLGRFSNAEDAGLAYINYKNGLARELAVNYEGILSKGVIEVLSNFNIVDRIPYPFCEHKLYLTKHKESTCNNN